MNRHIPDGIVELAGFRRWMHPDDFPERGRIPRARAAAKCEASNLCLKWSTAFGLDDPGRHPK